MTMKYVRNGDGYTVHSRERAVCVVHTKTSEYLPERKGPDGRVLPAEVVDRHLPQHEWQFHFCHGFYTPLMLKELLDLLPKADPDNGRAPAGEQLRLAEKADAAAIRNAPQARLAPLEAELEAREGTPPSNSFVPPDEDAQPFVLSPADEAKRRLVLEHHERVINATPSSDARAATPPI